MSSAEIITHHAKRKQKAAMGNQQNSVSDYLSPLSDKACFWH